MNTSSLCQFALILQTSSSALESSARKALEDKAQSDFFWLLGATAFVAIGIAFEYPEVKHEFIEWLRSRKKPWVIEPVPTSRNMVPLWSLIGFIIVTVGVAGEGVYEGLLGINDTKLRKMDEVSIASDELQIAQLQKDNLTLQKQAGDAATSAHNAAVDAGLAKTNAGNAEALARGTRTEVEATEKEALRLKEALADRVLNDDQIKSIADKMSKYVGQAYTFSAYRVPESTTIGGDIRQALQMAHWRFFGPEVRETKGGLVGISIDCHPDADKVTLDAVHDLNKVLWSEGLVVTEGIDPTISERNTIHIAIGTKR